MKGSALATAILLGTILVTGIACGGSPKLPDLVVEDCGTTGWPCDLATVVLVKNIGESDAGPFAVTLGETGTTAGEESINVSGLPAGQETSLQFEYHFFGHWPSAGSMTVTVDASAQVMESNESNNHLTEPQAWIDPGPTPCPSLTTTPTTTQTIINVNESDSGSTITMQHNQFLVVTLESNPGSTGYSWNLSQISDSNVIQWISDEYIEPEATTPIVIGRPGHEVWTFETLDDGTATITMTYVIPGVPDALSSRLFEIVLNVE